MHFIPVITAKTINERLPGKNFEDLGGKPLWRWSYDYAISEGFKPAVLFHGPDSERMAQESGIEVITSETVIIDHDKAIRMAIGDAQADSHVIILQPTNPFRPKGLIHEAIRAYKGKKLTSAIPVKTLAGPQWRENGVIYIAPLKALQECEDWTKFWVDAQPFVMERSFVSTVDIDYPEDLFAARLLLPMYSSERILN